MARSGYHVILDTFWLTNDIYIDEWLNKDEEKQILKQMSSIDQQMFRWPDLIISLSADLQVVKRNAIAGGRSFEQNDDYLKRQFSLNLAHKNFFEENNFKNTVSIHQKNNDIVYDQIQKSIQSVLSKNF